MGEKDFDVAEFILMAIFVILAWGLTVVGVFYVGYKIMFALTDWSKTWGGKSLKDKNKESNFWFNLKVAIFVSIIVIVGYIKAGHLIDWVFFGE